MIWPYLEWNYIGEPLVALSSHNIQGIIEEYKITQWESTGVLAECVHMQVGVIVGPRLVFKHQIATSHVSEGSSQIVDHSLT